MATRTVVTLVDDLDGTTADERVSFGLEGVGYEIDLSTENAAGLRELLAPFAAAARRSGRRRPSRPREASSRAASSPGATGASRSRSVNAEIRSWAAAHGVVLPERGRIPSRVVEAFEAGDPTRLPSDRPTPSKPEAAKSEASKAEASNTVSSNTVSSTAEPSSTATTQPAPDAAEPTEAAPAGESRGRDGLTATEREKIRAWAVEEGIEVKARGQLKKDLISNYRALEARRS